MKNFVYKVFERNFRSRFVPAMEALKLQCTPLCLPAIEIGEVTKETEEASRHTNVIMEDTFAQLDRGKKVVFEEQQQAQDCESEQHIVVSENQNVAGTYSGMIPEVILKNLDEMGEEIAIVR